ncbi:SMP-30/gluconolactonase/LRE family protein [Microbispora sp. NPDC046933]|uniref:SMP-30/gluconolactonase/LRE family protein n=1 Tax=Microbispora sp. NPDC046933 TaxID=3155618 RepID=UPI0033CB8347
MIRVSEPVALPVPRSALGEGARWDHEAGRLLWVDIPAGLVHTLAGGRHESIDVGRPVTVAVPAARGGLALALREGFALLTAGGPPEVLATVIEAGGRMNDGACDSAGRFFAGTMTDAPGVGALYRLGADRHVERVVGGVTISNGIAWSPDESLMYYVDTALGRVDVFDYDPGSGDLANRRTFVPVTRGRPDGITVDASGHVWVAVWEGGAVLRYGPGGRLDLVVEIPASRVTSCAFGGPGLDELYVTTASDGRTGGEVFRCRTSATGLPAHPYRG